MPGPGYDLHRVGALPVAPGGEVAPSGHNHALPRMELLVGQRLGEGPVEVDHHVGDALLRRPARRAGGGDAETAHDGSAHRIPVEERSLNLRCGERLKPHDFDQEPGFFVLRNMAHDAEMHPVAMNETPLVLLLGTGIPDETGPLRLLPVPTGEQ